MPYWLNLILVLSLLVTGPQSMAERDPIPVQKGIDLGILFGLTPSKSIFDCEEMVEATNTLAVHHVKAMKEKKFVGELQSPEYAEKVVKAFLEAIDPTGAFLTQSEFEEIKEEGVAKVKLFLHNNDKSIPACDYFASLVPAIENGKQRYQDAWTQLIANEDALLEKTQEYVNREQSKQSSDEVSRDIELLQGAFPIDLKEIERKIFLSLAAKAQRTNRENLQSPLGALRTAIRYYDNLLKDMPDLSDESQINTLAAKGYIEAFDQHSTYFHTDELFANYQLNLSAGMSGLGLSVQMAERGILVQNVFENGPSARQGKLKKGDVITAIDGNKEWALWNIDKAVLKLRGPEGSSVRLEVLRDGEIIPNITVARRTYSSKGETIKEEIIEWGGKTLGYLHFGDFYMASLGQRSADQDVRMHVESLIDRGAEGLVLDVRNNPGGTLQVVSNIVGHFVGHQYPVAFALGPDLRNPYPSNIGSSESVIDLPLVILVNENSASASEILAGAMQAYNRGVVVGSTPTYGKGSVQTVASARQFISPLMPGGFKTTVAHYFLPNGQTPQDVGIIPDILYTEAEKPESKLVSARWLDLASEKNTPSSLERPDAISPFISQKQKRMSDETYAKALEYTRMNIYPYGSQDLLDKEKEFSMQVLSKWIDSQRADDIIQTRVTGRAALSLEAKVGSSN